MARQVLSCFVPSNEDTHSKNYLNALSLLGNHKTTLGYGTVTWFLQKFEKHSLKTEMVKMLQWRGGWKCPQLRAAMILPYTSSEDSRSVLSDERTHLRSLVAAGAVSAHQCHIHFCILWFRPWHNYFASKSTLSKSLQ